MDPKAQFEARYKAYIEKRNQTLNQAHVKEAQEIIVGGSGTGGSRFKFGYGLILLLALAVPATVLLLGQTQDIRQRASGPENVVPQGAIKQIGSTYITNSDVDLKIQQLYGTNSAQTKNDLDTRNKILDQLIRERVIKQEAAKLNITVTDAEVDAKAKDLRLSSPFDKTIVFNMVVEDKLKDKVVAWRKADYLIAYKEASTTSPSIVGVKKILTDVKSTIDTGKTIKEAWANSGQINTSLGKTISLIENGKIYQGAFPQQLIDKIFSYKTGQTTDVLDSGGGVFVLAQITDSNNSSYKTFDEWYKATLQLYTK